MSEKSFSWAFNNDHVESWAYWIDGFNPMECDAIIDYCKKRDMEEGVIYSGNGDMDKFISNRSVRDSKIGFIQPSDEISWVYQRLTEITTKLNDQYFKFDLWGFAEGLQFTEYKSPGQKYNEHVDKMDKGLIRKLTIVLQLTNEEDYEGCDLELLLSENPLKMIRKQGTLLAFPSYTLHRVTPITKGTRHSLVGWVTGRPFK